MATMREDVLLLQRLNAGSYDSFKLLYDQWVARLYQFVLKIVKSESTAQDIVQDTFVKVWENHETINSEHSFKSYLFTIAYHRIVDEFRKQLRHPLMPDYITFTSSMVSYNEAEQNLSLEEFIRQLEKAKTKLSPRQRQVFEMSKEQNLPHSEIEKLMGISNQAVRNLLTAAMKTIRQELEPFAPLLILYCQL